MRQSFQYPMAWKDYGVLEARVIAALNPNVASFPLDQAKKLLNDAGFATLEVQQEENDGVAPDTVLGTTPAAGTQVAKGQKIVIRVAVASQAPASPGPSEQPSAPRSADDDEGDDDPTASPTRGG